MRKPILFETSFSNYTGQEIIGEGGSGRVYKAVDESRNVYAIKMLDASKATGDKLRRFKNEIHYCERNQHPNIVTVTDHGIITHEGKKSPFYVMPFYSSSLRELIENGIPHNKVLLYFGQILDGLEAAHKQRVIHRDIKPENILYDTAQDRLVIADFGIAHFNEENLFTSVNTQVGARLANFQYAAPEQRIRAGQVDQRADIYALGLILNEMFTKEVPQGTNYKCISAVAPDYSYLDDLVSTMLRQAASERPASIEVVKGTLIGRRNDFITFQKISSLKQTVVPVTEIDDPILQDPIRIIGFDWDKNRLTLILSQPVNQNWIWALSNMGSYSSLMGKPPQAFHFSGNKAEISVEERQVQAIIDYFKSWLPAAHRTYENKIRSEIEEADRQKRLKLQREIEEQERRQRVLRNVKI